MELEHEDHQQKQHESEVLAALGLDVLEPVVVYDGPTIDFVAFLELPIISALDNVDIGHVFHDLIIILQIMLYCPLVLRLGNYSRGWNLVDLDLLKLNFVTDITWLSLNMLSLAIY